MNKITLILTTVTVTSCHTYIPVAVRCEPPKDIVAVCPQPDASFALAVTKSSEQDDRELALIRSIADMKQKLDVCSAKQLALTDLLSSCNQIVDRTVSEIKKLK